jgi:membrane protease YdiL (CAAX protease family)
MSAALWYIAYLIGWSILFRWMYNNTRGSVLLAVLLHGSLDAGSADLIPGSVILDKKEPAVSDRHPFGGGNSCPAVWFEASVKASV